MEHFAIDPVHLDSAYRIHLKLLVIAPERSDPNLRAITQILDQMGTPYEILIATEDEFSEAILYRDKVAFYQGIVLTTGNLFYWNAEHQQWESAFSQSQWEILWEFEKRFGIRHLVLYALGYSPESYGFQHEPLIDTAQCALHLAWTQAGRQVFPYLNHDTPLVIRSACVYPAQPIDPTLSPLLLTEDGHMVAAIQHSSDGREVLALTIAQNPDLLHTQILGYGLVNWVTRGLFIGERRSYLTIQIDDIFNRNTLWDKATESNGNTVCRLGAEDAKALVSWLNRVQSEVAGGAAFTLDFAFNAAGIVGEVANDHLADTLLQNQERFRWINHGFTHLNLDRTSYAESLKEISENHFAAQRLGLTCYDMRNMVTAVVSGLENSEFLRAARDFGIRFIVSDTSRRGWNNPMHNTGIANPLETEIFCIPRRPTNLYFDVSQPDEWESKYNHIYRTYWGKELSVEEILEQEANAVLRYIVKSDIDPLMFHQANLRAYDGQNSLLSRLLDRVFAKYKAIFCKLPIISLSMDEISNRMKMREIYNGASVEAVLVDDRELVLRSDRDLTMPMTGWADNSELYEEQPITYLSLRANTVLRLSRTQKIT